MTDRPILFSPEMIRAILAGRKTQTRRVLPRTNGTRPTPIRVHQGDRLYVREAWKSDRYYDDLSPSQMSGEEPLIYLADDTVQRWGWKPDALSRWGRFRQGMHMPKWASRITLHVSDVRVERVQDISAADSIAEGVECTTCAAMQQSHCNGKGCFASIADFRNLWNTINAPRGYGWDVNPWVTATTFEPEFCNISEART